MDALPQRETLAGYQGHCKDYRQANMIGHSRQPFTWLSINGLDEENQRLASELRGLKHTREAAGFEVWELESGRWRLLYSEKVQVIYVEIDGKGPKVRALLQWAPTVGSGPYTSLAPVSMT